MNDFDRHLEFELRLLLDPIAKAPAPPRKGTPQLQDETPVIELTLVTPVAVPVPLEVFA